MDDNDFNELLASARRGQQRMDTERSELFFETRMQSVLKATRQDFGPASRFQSWIRATVGIAAVTGIAAFLVLAGREAIDAEDVLTAWWTDNSAAWDLQLFN